ncbi:MAG: hypothetical protein OXC19_11250 [Bryobacterales bacterium]|nr:hypothetical protein [Bryobacterales bacterium]
MTALDHHAGFDGDVAKLVKGETACKLVRARIARWLGGCYRSAALSWLGI